jgi:dipeptidyl aminopeptidase/acylaminoacyl peptidase
MLRLADPRYNVGAMAKPKVAEFSPDGRRFVVVLRKGNLENNTNEYVLLLFQTATAFNSRPPEVLLKLASSSNRPAIESVSWLEDNDTLVFLGERPGEHHQLYTIGCRSKKLKKLTDHPTNVRAYSIAKKGGTFAFIAEKPMPGVRTAKALREGIRVTTQLLPDLIAGEVRSSREEDEIFFQQAGSGMAKRIELQSTLRYWGGVNLSPSGDYLVLLTSARNVPESWKEYKDENLKKTLDYSSYRYTLVDTRSGQSEPLIDAPIGFWGTEVAWSPDGRSVIVTDVHLPLDGVGELEREVRRGKQFVVEVRIPGREVVEFPNSDLRLIRWDTGTNKVLFQLGRMNAILGKQVPRLAYSWDGKKWKETDFPEEAQDVIDVSLEEDLNTPPQIFVRDAKLGKRELLFDLNPQLSTLKLARVEYVRWKAADGHDVDGGLYIPPDYVAGRKYPLVLQTHGFTSQRFWMDGPWTTAFAAQALAGKGFVVLQVPDWPDLDQYPKIVATQAEGPYQMSSIEGAIDYLDARGLIDRDRVGIIGFSRSGFYVKYTLTHSKYSFAAAANTDSTDVGYFNYLALSNAWPSVLAEDERMIGSSPFGAGLAAWVEKSPGFNLHKVQTPLRIEAPGHRSLMFEWEWFAGLTRLGKPVELIYQPDASHILEKPWERLVSQQGNVDWFCFWLKGEEDPDPAKAEQYAYWRMLRRLHEQKVARSH